LLRRAQHFADVGEHSRLLLVDGVLELAGSARLGDQRSEGRKNSRNSGSDGFLDCGTINPQGRRHAAEHLRGDELGDECDDICRSHETLPCLSCPPAAPAFRLGRDVVA
jgi:hypothetical protein